MNRLTRPGAATAAKGLGLAVVLGLAIAFWWRFHHLIDLDALRAALSSLGPWAPAGLVALFVVQQLIPVFPNFLLVALAGLLFGLPWGVAWAWLGIVASAAVLYALGTRWGRRLIGGMVGDEHLLMAETLMLRRGAWAVLAIRMIPVLPSYLVSYLAGIVRIPFGVYLVGTAIGVLPGTVLYALLGERITRPSDPWFWAALLGLAALSGLAFTIDSRVKRETEL
ncbi:TVP38/TMEM64 family inner membrane protein YdjZ [compost metagenome]